MAPALCFRGVVFRYREDSPPAVCDLDLEVAPGEVVAVVGGNGSGKSTLARLANGLLQPLQGEVLVDGLSTADHRNRWEIHARVGLLFQDPEDQIVGATVEDDVAFGLENLGVPREEMRRRVAAIVSTVGLQGEEGTEPHLLSGGQKQRLALAGVLVLEPSVLVLDEPTSMLDPAGRAEVIAYVRSLAARGIGVLFITQHMEEALLADRLVALKGGRPAFAGSPREFFASGASRAFPLGSTPAMALWSRLGRRLVSGPAREAHLRAVSSSKEMVLDEDDLTVAVTRLVEGLGRKPAPRAEAGAPGAVTVGETEAHAGNADPTETEEHGNGGPAPASGVELRDVTVIYNRGTPFARPALSGVSLVIPGGAVTAVCGPTAAGKSSLLQVVAGLLDPTSGSVSVGGRARPRPGEVGMVFQRPEIQLFCSTVREDVAVAPRLQGLAGERLRRRVEWALELVGLAPEVFGERGPYTLSVGEQRRAALAGILSLDPPVLVLDEPGSGLYPEARDRLMGLLVEWSRGVVGADGDGDGGGARTLVFTSHDLDEVAAMADQVVVMDRGAVVAVGRPEEVLGDRALLTRVGLRPTLSSRVADRVGAAGHRSPSTAASLAEWIEAMVPA